MWNVADKNAKKKKLRTSAPKDGPSNTPMFDGAQPSANSRWMAMNGPYEQETYSQHVNVELKQLMQMQSRLAYSRAMADEDVTTALVAQATLEVQRKK